MLAFSLLAVSFFTQVQAQSLEQIKAAADAGDPAAQDKFAEQFILRGDLANAEIWYRKSSVQGYAHAQGRLGNMLLMRARMWVSLKPPEKAALADEALKWAMLAANQGDTRGQADLADMYLEGKFVKQDLIEAYKWGELSSRGSLIETATITGQSVRNNAILKMSEEQISEGHKRVAAFTPHQITKADIPDPSWVRKVKLEGISGATNHRLAIICGKTFAKGDETAVKIDGKNFMVRCLDIRESSVDVSIAGIEGARELIMPGN